MYNNTRVNYQALEFDHIVEFTGDSTVFAAARENGSRHMRIFLVNELTGHVYTRNGRADSWEQVYGADRDTILDRLSEARQNHTPVYRINGTNGSI